MTNKQKYFIWYWSYAALSLIAIVCILFIPLEDYGEIFLVLAFSLLIITLFKDYSYYTEEGWINDIFMKYPIVKYWMIIFCSMILPYLIFKIQRDDNVFLAIFSLLILFVPIYFISEFDRFLEMGKSDNSKAHRT